MDKVIYLTLINGTGYIFNVDDYMKLRKEHRIVGTLVGTTNIKGWSAKECTLPVELTEFETRLLVDQGIAKLVSKKSALLKDPSDEILDTYKKDFECRLLAQMEELKAEKLREAKRNLDKIVLGKKRKLLKDNSVEPAEKLSATDVLEEIDKKFEFKRENALLDIPCAHPVEHTAEIVHWPEDKSLKYQVFCDIWNKKKFITNGDAFGADFLVYPGDPLLFHASHIIIILDTPNIQPLDLIAKARLSVTVNKKCVFAYMARKFDHFKEYTDVGIQYQTVTWEGNKKHVGVPRTAKNDLKYII